MANLRLSDGRTISFPDGLTPEQVRKIVDAAKTSQPAASAKEEYDALPWYGKAAQAADDTMRFLANGMTLGYADKFAGYMNGEGTDAERQKTARAHERAGSAGTAAEIVGTMIPAVTIAATPFSASRYVPSTLKGAAGLLGRSVAAGVDGATLGAVQATGYDTDPMTGAAIGFAGGAGGNLVGEGVGAALNKTAGLFTRPKQPSVDELQKLGTAAFKQADNAGVIFKPEAIDKLRQTVYADMAEKGFHPKLQPGAATAYDEMARLVEGGNVDLTGLKTLRELASGGYVPGNKKNNAMISQIINRIDEFASSAGANDLVAGDAAAASKALSEGRDYWSRFRKLEKVQQLLDRAELNAGSSGSGGNIENATRQQLKTILRDKNAMRGFTDDEIEAIRKAVLGSKPQNLLRLLGKLSPQGNGLMLVGQSALTASNPYIGLPLTVTGVGAKMASEAMTRSNAEAAKRLIAAGGNKAALLGEPNAAQQLIRQYQPLLGRAIMSGALVGTPRR